MKKKIVIIDPGHVDAGDNHFKCSPVIESIGRRHYEWESNWAVAKQIKAFLAATDIEVHFSIPSPKSKEYLTGRAIKANQIHKTNPGCRIFFLSLHSNAANTRNVDAWSNAKGIEVWFFHNSIIGKKLAEFFANGLYTNLRRMKWPVVLRKTPVISRPSFQFTVLSKTNMPAVLCELNFFTNKDDVNMLINDAFISDAAAVYTHLIKQVFDDYVI